jgi:hypothetical protein
VKRTLTATLAGVVAVVMSAAPAPAHARDPGEFNFVDAGYHLIHGRWGAISPFFGMGASQLGAVGTDYRPTVVGLRYTERKGFVTGLFFALLNSIAGGMAANSPKSVRSYRSGNYIITETTYRSEAERQAMLAQTAATSAAMLEAEDQAFEFEIYSHSLPGGGETSGHKLNMYFGLEIADWLMVDIGLGFGAATSRFERDGVDAVVEFSYLGMPLKANFAAGPMLIYLAWDWNWLGEWTGHGADKKVTDATYRRRSTNSHIELGLQTALFERVLLSASMTTPEIDSGEFGFRASAGIRF